MSGNMLCLNLGTAQCYYNPEHNMNAGRCENLLRLSEGNWLHSTFR